MSSVDEPTVEPQPKVQKTSPSVLTVCLGCGNYNETFIEHDCSGKIDQEKIKRCIEILKITLPSAPAPPPPPPPPFAGGTVSAVARPFAGGTVAAVAQPSQPVKKKQKAADPTTSKENFQIDLANALKSVDY